MNTQSPPDAPPGAAGKSASRPESTDSAPSAHETAAAAFADAKARLGEIREYISYYLAAKADAFKLSLRTAVFYAALGVIGLIGGAAAIVVAVALLLVGGAHGIGAALGDRMWLGDLILGAVVLALLALGARIAISKVFGASRKQTVEKYESRKREQRTRFGHDVGTPPSPRA